MVLKELGFTAPFLFVQIGSKMAKKRPKSAASFVQKSGQKSGQRPKKVGKIGKICTDEAGLVSLWPKKVGFCPVLKKKVGREFWQKMAKNGQKRGKNGQK